MSQFDPATNSEESDHLPPPRSNEGELVTVDTGSTIIPLPTNASIGNIVQLLSKNVPTNEYGMPVYFIRSDLLHYHSNPYLTQDDVDAATVGLFYHDGYPTLEDGASFWNQLPHETYDRHLLFTKYLEMAAEYGVRQLDILAVQEGLDTLVVQQLYQEFYWSIRARAYDLFVVAADRKKREIRTRKMENSHYEQAGALLTTLLTKFEDPEWIEELNAKEALEALELLVKVQRLSVGLTGQHASSLPRDALPAGSSTEQVMRQLTRDTGLSNQASDNFKGRLDALLQGDDGMVLQEAILRFNTTPTQFGAPDDQLNSAAAGLD